MWNKNDTDHLIYHKKTIVQRRYMLDSTNVFRSVDLFKFSGDLNREEGARESKVAVIFF
jgi:hypothetical protein